LVFGRELDVEGQQFFRNFPDSSTPAILWRFDPFLARLTPGYVWEEDGRIVGNVTLLPTGSQERFLVANVAVHPEYRRRGIAHLLMETVHEEVVKRKGEHILLQVDHDNDAAIELYRNLNYEFCGSMTTWRTSVSRLRDLPSGHSAGRYDVKVRKLDSRRWQQAYELDNSVVAPELQWPEALSKDCYKQGLWQKLADMMNGRFRQSWMTLDSHKQMNGLASICGEWGRPHQLAVRVHPGWRGELEGALLQQLIDRSRKLPRRTVQMIHPAQDETMNELLTAASFGRHRTLSHMRLKVAG
jgi:GNAT superfamily N-acetyltransferase